ncbi:MAG TPA: COX15/CtaA family protein, partial [Saprospiraceae bacterium]|nr:COX15/CtaA family protein [Saprospiraceae bacterium]
ILTIIMLWFIEKTWRLAETAALRIGLGLLLAALLAQVLLGILTVINCVGSIPVALGVLHQAGGVLLLTAVLYVYFQVRQVKN